MFRGGRGRRGGRGGSKRKYGFFRCSKCNANWESSHVYEKGGTVAYTKDSCIERVVKLALKIHMGKFRSTFCQDYYQQECKSCRIPVSPYKVEPIKCSICGEEDCICTEEERQERHTDPNKPHRSDLCER